MSRYVPGLTAAALLAAGCSANPNVESVTGTVTLDGKPAAGVIVGFWPGDPDATLGTNNFGRAVTDEMGTFAVPGDATSGFAPGEYRLCFSRILDAKGKPQPDAKPGEDRCRETLSAAYLAPDTSGVRVALAGPSTALTLDLKTSGMPPPPPLPSSVAK